MSSSSRPALKEGEWACVDAKCAQVNSDKRRHCQKCGKDKPRAKQKIGREIGKEAAEKSKGLFSAEDWVCTKCGNVNWARRIMCNVCNAPKLADLEVRTGYGGGYMDREDVEYIQREDNEEFDEFGRKKRRKKIGEFYDTKGIEENIVEESEISEEKQEEQEEVTMKEEVEQEDKEEEDEEEEEEKTEEESKEDEEEEEDGDEADLGKYDLSADPELANLAIDLLKRRTQGEDGAAAESMADNGKRSQSVASSDCSCSCSGGECSCVDSEEEKAATVKRPKVKDESDLNDVKRPPQEKERSERREHDRIGQGGARHRERARSRESSGRSARSRERDREDGREKAAAKDRESARDREGRRGEAKEQRHHRRDHRQDSREREEKGREERNGARRRSRDR